MCFSLDVLVRRNAEKKSSMTVCNCTVRTYMPPTVSLSVQTCCVLAIASLLRCREESNLCQLSKKQGLVVSHQFSLFEKWFHNNRIIRAFMHEELLLNLKKCSLREEKKPFSISTKLFTFEPWGIGCFLHAAPVFQCRRRRRRARS